jgi:uncharacterized protein YdaT
LTANRRYLRALEFHLLPDFDEEPPPVLREKAIEIANALLEEGMEEGKAIRIAFAKTTEWARSHAIES